MDFYTLGWGKFYVNVGSIWFHGLIYPDGEYWVSQARDYIAEPFVRDADDDSPF